MIALLSVFVTESTIAQQGINAPPDSIFYNGKIITVDSGFTIQQAFAVRGDAYVAVGTNARIQALASENTRLVDLKGAAVIPGLSDNHDHLYNSEKVMRGIDLVGATSTEEVLRRLRDGLAKAKGALAGSWKPADQRETPGGRLYATALRLLMLEVYYRHLPLYQQLEK